MSAPLGFSLLFNGGTVNPRLHFVFVGANEGIYVQDNNACDSTISSLALRPNGEQAQQLGGPLPPAPSPAPTGCSFYGDQHGNVRRPAAGGRTELALGFGGPGSLTFPLAGSQLSTQSNGTWRTRTSTGDHCSASTPPLAPIPSQFVA